MTPETTHILFRAIYGDYPHPGIVTAHGHNRTVPTNPAARSAWADGYRDGYEGMTPTPDAYPKQEHQYMAGHKAGVTDRSRDAM